MAKSMPRQRPGRSEQSVCTPIDFLQAVKARLGIDAFTCDLAASRENTVAKKFYSKASNSLEQPWNLGGWNWLNPEFSDLAPWVKKACEEAALGARTVVLVPAGVGANWWRDWVHKKAHVLLLNGRLTFIGHKQPYPKDCALLIYARYKAGDPHNPLMSSGYEVWPWAAKDASAPVTASSPDVVPAIDRLRADAPDGPPFLGLMLDEATVRCLAAGSVNSRAEVAARHVIDTLDTGIASVRDRAKRTA